jgi:hypothetical protein
MSTNEIILKISIDGKEANATLNLTDTNIKELYKSFKYGKQEVNGLTTAISQGFNNAREMIIGFNILSKGWLCQKNPDLSGKANHNICLRYCSGICVARRVPACRQTGVRGLKCDKPLIEMNREYIRKHFGQKNEKELARELGVSERLVYKIGSQKIVLNNQHSLFED